MISRKICKPQYSHSWESSRWGKTSTMRTLLKCIAYKLINLNQTSQKIQYKVNIDCKRGNIGNCHLEKTTVSQGEAETDSGYQGVTISNVTLLCGQC